MAAKNIKYRTCELDIREPTEEHLAWSVVIWPTNRRFPIVMPSSASEAGAIAAAEAKVDEILGSPRPSE